MSLTLPRHIGLKPGIFESAAGASPSPEKRNAGRPACRTIPSSNISGHRQAELRLMVMAAVRSTLLRSLSSFPFSRDAKLRSSGRLFVAIWSGAPLPLFVKRTFAAARDQKVQPLKKKRRLDEVCLEKYQQYSRTFIQSWIIQGKVFVDGKMVDKAGTPVSEKANVEILAEVPKYVCRAGYKLEAAIEQLKVDVNEKVVLDSGLSTGGFTDCLLQHGAAFVYGIDVGYGQVADKIRHDHRVCVMERTNLRYLSGLPQKVDLVTLDVSFISILMVLPAVIKVMKEESTLVTLVKPQFEARRSQVGKGGIVRDPAVHQEVLEKIIKGVEELGFCKSGWIESPLKGVDGNTEFLVSFRRTSQEQGGLSS